jgi:hypothetical protein
MQQPTPGVGHNRPPPQRRRVTLQSAIAVRLIAELVGLRQSAIGECNKTLRDYTSSDARFFPSYLKKWPTGRSLLQRQFRVSWDVAISKRLGQMQGVNRKLARITSEWTLLTDAELTERPRYDGRENHAYHDTVNLNGVIP